MERCADGAETAIKHDASLHEAKPATRNADRILTQGKTACNATGRLGATPWYVGTTIQIVTTPLTGASCTYSGTFSQDGQMGSVAGTYGCDGGLSGSFNAFEMQVNRTGVTGRFTDNATALHCSGSGWFGGVRVTTF